MGKDWNAGTNAYGTGYGPKPHLQRQIDRTMAETIAHPPYSPGEMPASETVRVGGAVTVVETPATRGWVDSRPLEPPLRPGSFAERTVGAMIDQAFPPSPAEKLDRIKAELRALTPAQRAQLLRDCEARAGDPLAAQLKALVETVGASGGC